MVSEAGAGSGRPGDVPPGRRTVPSGAYSARRGPGPAPGAVPGPPPVAPSPHRPPAYPEAPPGGVPYRDDPYGGDEYSDGYTDGGYDSYYEDDYADDEYAEEGEDLSRRRGCRSVLLVAGLLLVVGGVAAWFGWSWVQGQIDPAGEPGETVLVEIPAGASTSDIGHELADAGVISNATVWDWYIRVSSTRQFQAGRYEMQLNSSFSEAIDALERGALPPNATLVTVPEGLTVAETIARLTDPEKGVPGFTPEAVQAALADAASRSALLPADQPSLEGTLFPDSYQVEEGDTPAVVVQRMVGQLDETMTDLDVQGRAQALGRTPYELLVVASLVEEEARVDGDRARVARVIYNRLAEGMPLQIDATSCYAKGEPGCSLSQSDLGSDSPYNTRNRQGLPPTPIAAPGRASIEAALAPAEGDWLYYVIDAEANDGSHLFTADYDEFVEAKNRCADAGLGCG